MGTAAFYPTALYTTNTAILDNTLTQSEWQQVAVEVENVEAELGTSPSGTASTVVARLDALGGAGGLSATGHSSLGTSATHPFSALTGTFTAVQHGNLTGTAATHDTLVNAATVLRNDTSVNGADFVLQASDTATYGDSFTLDMRAELFRAHSSGIVHFSVAKGANSTINSAGLLSVGSMQATSHGSLTTSATHPFSALTGTFTAAQHGDLSGSTAAVHTGSAIVGTIGQTSLTQATGAGATAYSNLNPRAHVAEHHSGGTDALTVSSVAGAITATQHGALSTAATHPFSALTGTFTAVQHGNLTGTAATHDHGGTGQFFIGPTAAVTVNAQLQTFSTAALAGITSRDTSVPVESYMGPADGDKAIAGSMTNHPFHIRTNNTLRIGIDGVGAITAMPALPATAHGALTSTAATHPMTSLTNFYGARVHATAAQTITSGVDIALSFGSADYDIGGFFATATFTRLTAPAPGIYLVAASMRWADNTAGQRALNFRQNGATFVSVHRHPVSTGIQDMSNSTVLYLASGDYIEAMVQQNSGADLNVNRSNDFTPEFIMQRLGPSAG